MSNNSYNNIDYCINKLYSIIYNSKKLDYKFYLKSGDCYKLDNISKNNINLENLKKINFEDFDIILRNKNEIN